MGKKRLSSQEIKERYRSFVKKIILDDMTCKEAAELMNIYIPSFAPHTSSSVSDYVKREVLKSFGFHYDAELNFEYIQDSNLSEIKDFKRAKVYFYSRIKSMWEFENKLINEANIKKNKK